MAWEGHTVKGFNVESFKHTALHGLIRSHQYVFSGL
jgi:hypothetical protein